MSGADPRPDRLDDLLAARAVEGLSPAERDELAALLAAHPGTDADELDRAAAAIDLALAKDEALPALLRERLLADARLRIAPAQQTSAGRSGARFALAGWLAAAACLLLAAIAWWPGGPAGRGATGADVEAFARAHADTVRAAWGDFNDLATGAPPEFPGVKGEVVWSDSAQRGFMRLTGLPASARDPGSGELADVYQLWIVDGTRGLGQRISGAIFANDAASGELIIPIEPRLRVNAAAVFAVTVERPGGVWVSDMSRRVCLAAVGG